MKTLMKTLLQGVAIFAVGFSIHTFNSAHAIDENSDSEDVTQSDDNADQGSSGSEESDTNADQGSSGSEDESTPGTEEQQSAGPTLQVQVQMDMSGEYQQMFNKEQEKFQILLRALNDTKNSTKGSKPVRIDLNGGEATFDDKAGDEPKGVLVALSKVGNTYQHFCSGKGIKDGVITSFPKGINITLKNGNKPYKTSAGVLRNDSYPNCEVEVQN